MQNLAFIDGQNIHLGTLEENLKINFKKLRIYLKDKYKIKKAYYFLGYYSKKEKMLYQNIQRANFIPIFKEHSKNYSTTKKGNVDSDIIFEIMKSLIDEDFNKVVIMSGDGDYKKLVDYLILKHKFLKILFPNKHASYLYNKLSSEFFDYLSNIKKYIEYSDN